MEPIRQSKGNPLAALLLVFAGSLVLTACNSESSDAADANDTPLQAPSFQALDDLTLIRGQIVEAELINNGGGSLTSCVADLPQGFVVSVSANGDTCEVTGTATEATELESADIIATNDAGEDTLTVTYQVEEPTAFITTWDTDVESGISANDEITLQTNPNLDYNFTVDWGDGTSDKNVTKDITHQYVQPGTYTVTISGLYPAPYFDFELSIEDELFIDNSDASKLLSVEQWGNRFWASMEQAFPNANNLSINDLSTPNFSQVTSFRSMFTFNEAFNQDVSTWDTSAATDMAFMFADSYFDQDLSNWDIENVKDMNGMFSYADLSIENYDRLLLSWSEQTVQPNVTLDVDSRFTPNAEAARNALINDHGWTINDFNSIAELFPKIDDQAIQFYTGQTFEDALTNNGNSIDQCEATGLPDGITISRAGNGMACNLQGIPTTAGFSQATVTASNTFGSDTALIDFNIVQQTPYITTWKTDNSGSSDDNQISLKVNNSNGYNFSVDWGDGSTDENLSETITHTYSTAGTYTVSITGDYPLPLTDDPKKLLTIEQWGQRSWQSMTYAYANTEDLVILATDAPDLSRVHSLKGTFSRANNFNSDISTWDVSNVGNFEEMFLAARAFNQPIGQWEVSNASNMRKMFENADAFNQDIGNWDVSNVTSMRTMFNGANTFNQDIGDWDVSNVRDMNAVFKGTLFNQDISRWNLKNATNATQFFDNNSAFSTENYDKLLIAWSQNPELVEDLEISFGNIQYSAAAKAARDILINDFNWTIKDGGELLD
ncbi:BspA family leucine-rich repeat surface protein [Reinekea blandensis]|uniref:Transmembrane protein, putative n=1 Tax=Reinekea blandensis MED297 TaxID=314283 RepID=A4BCD4_9GAMM|nr:BspA family leucine-rich repeat surface protein [Reinekea blandensis]EAR10200.1 transmembrane protein, putative [Reinekea sp. MED297] [Reinekea blandensis MED297]